MRRLLAVALFAFSLAIFAPLTHVAASVATSTQPPIPTPSHRVTQAASASAFPRSYTVKAGDTLSKIAKHAYGSSRLWPALWWANRHMLHNPNVITAGQRLRLSSWHPHRAWLTRRALAAVPPPPPVHVKHHSHLTAYTPSAPPSAPQSGGSYGAAPGSFQACVIQAESGGNPDAQNPTSTASGLYGFLDTTWTSVTGLPGPARAYSVATQNAAFLKLYAEDGTAPWAAYDGCS